MEEGIGKQARSLPIFIITTTKMKLEGGTVVKNPPTHGSPAVHETQVQCLGQEDPVEEEMAIHSSILA